MALAPLPIDAHLDRIAEIVRRHRAAVVVAAPGAGKTTRVPPALAVDGRVIVLQPRRVAARAIAGRIADERGWTLGREVGWHVRFERRFGDDTRVLLATEGLLTRRLQVDPLLSEFTTVILDEFHERSQHADLGLALARQAARARDDLRIVVMSATMDAAGVSRFLGDCPIVDVPGRAFPIEIAYAPTQSIEDAVAGMLPRTRGSILCFLPGAPEIRRAEAALARRLSGAAASIVPLHGGLDSDQQDAAIRHSSSRRVVLATNIAETTLTVPDVTAVIDTGLQKIARYDHERGVDSLELERVSLDSADQRAGRAGRTSPGQVVRLWDARDRLRPHREPELSRVDLAGPVLDVLTWGGDPLTFAWFEAPPPDALDAATSLLQRLGAVDRDRRVTPLGRALQRVPVHPRLARMLVAANGAPQMALACALLSERHFVPARTGTTPCDLLAAVDDVGRLPAPVVRIARELGRAVEGARTAQTPIDEAEFRRAVLAGYPDRVARRRVPRGDAFVLASGAGATLSRESGVLNAEFVVATDVAGGTAPGKDALIRLATAIDRAWIAPTAVEIRHAIDASGVVRATRVELYDALVIGERPAPVDTETAAPLLAAAYLRRGWRDADRQLLSRLRFAREPHDVDALVRDGAAHAASLDDLDLTAALAPAVRARLDRLAPTSIELPTGRRAPLDYRDDGSVVLSVKLQQVFGWTSSPRVGAAAVPLTFELLAPSGRPVQVTQDLASFWSRTYPEVRNELRRRYPKHSWPEDPCRGVG